MFGVHPWQMLHLPALRREWYEASTRRHREREHEQRQQFLDAIGKLIAG